MWFPTQEYQSGLPSPSPGDFPHPGIKRSSLMSPALAGGFFTSRVTWEAQRWKRQGFSPGLGRSPGGGHGNPLQCSCLENFMDRGAWWATVHRVTKSRTRPKQLSIHCVLSLRVMYVGFSLFCGSVAQSFHCCCAFHYMERHSLFILVLMTFESFPVGGDYK